MTRRLRLLSLAILLLGIVLIPMETATAAPRFIEVHCTETPVSGPEGGTATFPDGNFHMRGTTLHNLESCDDPHVDGDLSSPTLNWNFRPNPSQPSFPWQGPIWGTWESTNPHFEGGTWSGTFTFYLHEDGTMTGHIVGTGAGPLAGWHYQSDFYNSCFAGCIPEYTNSIIFDTGRP